MNLSQATFVVALISALAALGNVGVSLLNRNDNRRRLKMEVGYSRPDKLVFVTVHNSGGQPLWITEIGGYTRGLHLASTYLLGGPSRRVCSIIADESDSCPARPAEIVPGSSATWVIPFASLSTAIGSSAKLMLDERRMSKRDRFDLGFYFRTGDGIKYHSVSEFEPDVRELIRTSREIENGDKKPATRRRRPSRGRRT